MTIAEVKRNLRLAQNKLALLPFNHHRDAITKELDAMMLGREIEDWIELLYTLEREEEIIKGMKK